MKNLEFYKRKEIETDDDMTFSIQASKTKITDAHGTYESDARIVLLIEDEENHKDMATVLSTDDVDKLITDLHTLNEQVKGYNRYIKGR